MSQRRPLALLVPLAFLAVVLVGCGDDDTDPEASASDTASETTQATTDAETTSESAEPTDSVPTTDSEELPDGDDGDGGDGRTDTPADAAELCNAFAKANQAFETSGADDLDDDQPVPPALLDAFRQWGQDLADADLPAAFSDGQRDGVGVMSELLLALPDNATGTQLGDLEDDLSAADEAKVKSVTDYVDDNCGVDGS